MSMLTVRNIPETIHHALRSRAQANGRSMEAEARKILTDAILPRNRVKMGTRLSQMVKGEGLTDKEHQHFENLRQITTLHEPPSL